MLGPILTTAADCASGSSCTHLQLQLCLGKHSTIPYEISPSPQTLISPLVRTQNLVSFVARPRTLEAKFPLKVLLVTVDSGTTGDYDSPSAGQDPRGNHLNTGEEVASVRAALAELDPGRIKLDQLHGRVTIQQLRERLVTTWPDILHFVGHGNEDGLLLWADGAPAFVSAASLRTVLQQIDSVKLVFINACLAGQVDSARPFASLAHQLLQSGLPAVIAMRYEIVDRSAANFAAGFYQALVSGRVRGCIDAAASTARNNLYINDPDRVDYATPILWLNAEDGRLLPFDDPPRPLSSRSHLSGSPHSTSGGSSLPLDFKLTEKEAWYRSLPETISDPHLPFEYQRRRRIIRLLLRILQQAAEERDHGRAIDVRAFQKRLSTFEEERRHIQNILDHCQHDS